MTLWPTWVAPNMVRRLSRICNVSLLTLDTHVDQITLSGLSIVIINFLTLLYYDPTYLAQKGGASVPQWVYYTQVDRHLVRRCLLYSERH